MKKLSFFVFLALFCLLNVSQLLAQGKKLALIVAVANYPKEGGWSSISSDKDIPLIVNALESQGFKDIKIITDKEAEKAGIIAAIEDLTKRAGKDDIVVFHYSGHGQQIKDDNGDEYDGYDEALVPYDARLRYEPGVYEGQNHLRDDELDVLFNRIREKLGENGNLLVILDACHSGTATRGMAKSRGTMEKMAPNEYKPDSKEDESGMLAKSPSTSSRGVASLASMMVLSGASPEQLNYETRDESGNSVGSLSYAFSRAVKKAGKESTYRGLFNAIKVDMKVLAPNQEPQAEGNMDIAIFGGQAVDQKAYFAVDKWMDENNIIIQAGSIMGLYENSTVEFHKLGTTDPSKSTPLATGTVVGSTTFTSTIKPSVPLDKETAMGTWIFIKEQNFGDMRVAVSFDVKNTDLNKLLADNFSKVGIVKIVDQNPDIVIEYNNKYTRGNNIQVSTVTDLMLYDKPYANDKSEEIIAEITNTVKAYAQGKILRNLELEASKYDVRFEFIPIKVDNDEKEKERYSVDTKKDANGNIIFNEGDYFKLKITNYGERRAFYNIIDIQPDNVVNLLVPVYDEKRQIRIPATEFKIDPGQSIELEYTFSFWPPFGNEVFKLIASAEPLNLEPIIMSSGTGTRGNMNPLELLISESYGNSGVSSRGGKSGYTPNIPQGNANTYTLVFKIQK